VNKTKTKKALLAAWTGILFISPFNFPRIVIPDLLNQIFDVSESTITDYFKG
jgi:hypothetical protein